MAGKDKGGREAKKPKANAKKPALGTSAVRPSAATQDGSDKPKR